jgi:hypothetical protein
MAALAAPRATADVAASCPCSGYRGRSARQRRRAPKGQRKAAGARRAAVPGHASQLRAGAAPRMVSGAVAGRFQDQRTVPARRAPRALEVVEQVITDHARQRRQLSAGLRAHATTSDPKPYRD